MLDGERLKLKEQFVQPSLVVKDNVLETGGETVETHENVGHPDGGDSPQAIHEQTSKLAVDPATAKHTNATPTIGDDASLLNAAFVPATDVPEESLHAMIQHPNTPEEEWLKACTELNRREQHPPAVSKPRKRRPFLWVAFACLTLIGTAGFIATTNHQSAPAPTMKKSILGSVPSNYQVGASQYKLMMLKQNLVVTVGQAIYERSWSEAEAAKSLQVDQKKIADLLRFKYNSLSIDELTQMAALMNVDLSSITQTIMGSGSSEMPKLSEQQQNDTVSFLTKAINLDGENSMIYRSRADAFIALKEYDRAIADLTRCIELKPGDWTNLEARANVYERAKNYKAALQDLNTMAAKFPEVDIYQSRAIVYMDLGDYDKAIQDSTRSIAKMKTLRPGPYYNRATCYEHLGKFKEALADYQKCLESDPRNTMCQNKIAELENRH